MKQILPVKSVRFWEMIPGILVWTTLAMTVVLSIWAPLAAVIFIIIFDLFWVTRIFYSSIYIYSSWSKLRKHLKIDWLGELKTNYQGKNFNDYWHLIFLPTYDEPIEVLRKTFQSLANINYDHQKVIIVLAGEARKEANFKIVSDLIAQEFNNQFFKILFTLHPTNLPDEIPGKGSNLNFAGHQVKAYIDELGLDHTKIIVSTFDCDTQPHPQYFSYLTKTFLDQVNPLHCSYQPVALYHNNFWESDLVTRTVANSTTFWLFTDLARSDRLFTFSSHSMSFQALVDIGFWEKRIVTEDSRMFLQCFYRYNGDYKTVPMFIPVYMNTVSVGNFWRSMVNQYKQMRRWAWGVEHLPYMVYQNSVNNEIPYRKKMKYLWNQLEGVYSWATAPLLITILGRLPLLLADKNIQSTALAQNAPNVLEAIMNAGLVGLVFIAVLNSMLMPKRPAHVKLYQFLLKPLEWIIFPVTMVVFGSIPAIDAQTRLMLGGKYRLGFWVTEKK